MSDEKSFEYSDEFGDLNFKSDFARKAIDQFKQAKPMELNSPEINQYRPDEIDNDFLRKTKNVLQSYPTNSGPQGTVKLRMVSYLWRLKDSY